jgi:hypothetical protein
MGLGERSRSQSFTPHLAPPDRDRKPGQLAFGIGFPLTRRRDLLRQILREHAPDDARRQLAERLVQHLERSNFEIDEKSKALRRHPPN